MSMRSTSPLPGAERAIPSLTTSRFTQLTRRLFLTLLALVVPLVANGCRFSTPQRKTQAVDLGQTKVAMTQNQLRLRMRGLVGPMCGEIEQAADGIMGSTTNRAIQRAALVWKIEAVPELREALFQPDPLTAGADTWVFCFQMADYFDAGPGKAALGQFAPTAAATCRQLEETIARVEATRTVSGDVSKTRAYARQWAADHPIQHSIAGRESTLTRVLDRDAMGTVSGGEVMADMTTAVDDLNRRIEVYADQLFRQARWEANLFKSEFLNDVPLDQALRLAERLVKVGEQAAATIDRLAVAAERALVVAESAPELITAEREAAIKVLQTELARTIKFVQEERSVAFSQLTEERVAALETMGDKLAIERKLLTEDLNRISLHLVDHATWRLAQLAAVMLLALFISAVLLLLLTRRLFSQGLSP